MVGEMTLSGEGGVPIAVDDSGPRATMADYGVFVAQVMPGLLRYGYALTGSTHDAADLVQTVLEKVGARWGKVRRGDDPLAYIRRSMANAHVSRWRRGRREIPHDLLPESVAPDHDRLDNEPLWQALRELPRRQRAVIVLRYYEGLSEAEIAASLGISRGTVKSQAARALDRLRTTVATMEGEL